MNRLLLVALCAAAAGGCVNTNAALMNPTAKYAPTCPDAVVFYSTPSRVGRPYTELALLHSTGNAGWTTEKGMYNSQRQKAAQIGANGVIVNDINEPGAGAKILGSLLGTGTERKGHALAIWVPDDSARTIAQCTGRFSKSEAETTNNAPTTYGTAGPAPGPAAPAPAASALVAPPPTAPAQVAGYAEDQDPNSVASQNPFDLTPASARNLDAPRPKARLMDDPPVPVQGQLMDDYPAGTQFIGDATSRTYFPATCPTAATIPLAKRLYYRNEANLTNAGFTRSPQC